MQHLLYYAPVDWYGMHSVITVSFHVVRLHGLNIQSTHILVFDICDWDGKVSQLCSFIVRSCLSREFTRFLFSTLELIGAATTLKLRVGWYGNFAVR